VDIKLYIKIEGEWSDPIPGTGGSSFVTKEKMGLYTSDECFKMALTDAISVACKALGFGADVYWDKDRTKYSLAEDAPVKQIDVPQPVKPAAAPANATGEDKTKKIGAICMAAGPKGINQEMLNRKAFTTFGKSRMEELTNNELDKLLDAVEAAPAKVEATV
jgi:hypothetical protein